MSEWWRRVNIWADEQRRFNDREMTIWLWLYAMWIFATQPAVYDDGKD